MIPPFVFSRDESNGAPESRPSSVFDSPRAMMNGVTPEMESRYYEQLVGNVTTLTREFFNRLADPRRDLDKECGFPRQMDAEQYWNLYNRNSFASRVVETIPLAVWKGNPEVYEDEDADEETEFEGAWRQMNADLRGERSFFQDEEGSPFWDCLKRADILSGIGQYGVILLGFDDGLDLRDPVDGVEELNSMPKPYVKRKKSGDDEEDDAPKLNPREKAEKRASKRKTITENKRYKLVWNAKGGSYGPPPNTYTGVSGDEYALREDEDEADKEPEDDALPFDEDQRGTGGDESTDPSLQEEETAWEPKVRLLYMRAFPEVMAQVATYETNPTSLRYGQPTSYTISFHDPREVGSAGAQPPSHTRVVHWTRVIHVNLEGLSSETYGVERMRQVYRNLLSIEKLVYASPEMFYKGAFPGMSFESHPQLGGQVQYDKAGMKRMMEDYQNGLQRYLLTTGGSAKMLAPAVADPTPHVNVQVEAICVRIGIPVPVFKGYEIGEQASQNNTKDWDDKVKGWRETNRTPRLIVPIVDRLINVGVLPEPTGYSIKWPEVSQQSATERAQVISTLTQAMVSYISGDVAQFMPPMEYLTRIWEMTTEEAESIVEAAEKVLEEQKAEQEAQLAEFGAPQFGPDGRPVPQPKVGPDGEPTEDDPFAPAEAPSVPQESTDEEEVPQ